MTNFFITRHWSERAFLPFFIFLCTSFYFDFSVCPCDGNFCEFIMHTSVMGIFFLKVIKTFHNTYSCQSYTSVGRDPDRGNIKPWDNTPDRETPIDRSRIVRGLGATPFRCAHTHRLAKDGPELEHARHLS